jgi:hypothetical protein
MSRRNFKKQDNDNKNDRQQLSNTALKDMEPLDDKDFEYINWSDSNIKFQGLVRFRSEPGIDTVHHCVLNAISVAYRSEELHGTEVSKKSLVRALRQELAHKLHSAYDTLNGGRLKEMVNIDPDLSQENLEHLLLTSMNFPKPLLEFVCDQLNIDLFYVSGPNRDVFPIMTEMELIIKGRRSVVVLYNRNRYELMGIHEVTRKKDTGEQTEEFVTVFRPDHPFINQLKRQLGL